MNDKNAELEFLRPIGRFSMSLRIENRNKPSQIPHKILVGFSWYSLRRCNCGQELKTDGSGYFECVCGFWDWQSVQQYYRAKLNYSIPSGETLKFNKRLMGFLKLMEEKEFGTIH